MAAVAIASALTVRGVERAVVVGEWWPREGWMRRSFTPASSRGVAHEWRHVCPEARLWRPLAFRAARKASCTLVRGMDVEAVTIPRPLRPGAGKSPTGWRWVVQYWRRSARVCWGSGTERSFAPLPSRTWTIMRALAISGTCRGVPSWSRRPQAERVLRQAR